MSVRKYRLAPPYDNDQEDSLYQLTFPISPSSPHRSIIFNKTETNVNKILLDNSHKGADTILSTSTSPRWWLVLPSLVLLMLVTAVEPLLLNDLIIRRYERRYGFNTLQNAQRQICRQSMTTSMPVYYWQFYPLNPEPMQVRPDYSVVQRDAANFQIKNAIIGLIPGLITFVLLGSNSDTIGRRPLLLLPFIGKIILYSMMLAIVSRDLSDAWLLAANGIESIFGSIGLVILSAFAYITDCTTGSMRPKAFLITEGILFLTRVLPILALGIWLRFYLYTAPLSVCLVLSVIGLVYGFFIQPESVENIRNLLLIQQLARIRLKPIIGIIKVFIVKRADNKRKQLVWITIVLILLQTVFLGYISIFTLYLYGRPMCLDALQVSLLSSVQAIVTFLLSVLTAACKKSFDNTYLAPILSTLSIIIQLIILSLAKRIWLLYIAVCIGSLSFIISPVLRTKLTATIEMNEYAIAFIGAGIIQTITFPLVSAGANGIYNATLNFFPGLIFMVFAGIELFPIVIMCYLAFLEWKTSKKLNRKKSPMTEIQL